MLHRSFAGCALALAVSVAGWVAAPSALAQDRIDRPVRILFGVPACGTVDLIARLVADKMKDGLGQPVVIDNRPGAIGRIAAEALKNAAPDGTTLMVAPVSAIAVVPHVFPNIPYDSLKDFAPVGLGATFPLAIAAGPASGAKTWAEFVAWAKANPGKASYATSGAGSLLHFYGVLLSREIGVDMTHVAYKGSAAYLNDLVGGQVPAAIDAIADLSELHRAGKIRVLASSGAKRSTALPDVPSFGELGVKGVEASGWFGFFVPARTPPALVELLNREINKALRAPDVAEKLTKVGLDPAPSTVDEFARLVASDHAKWGPVVRASGFKPE